MDRNGKKPKATPSTENSERSDLRGSSDHDAGHPTTPYKIESEKSGGGSKKPLRAPKTGGREDTGRRIN